MEPEGAAEETGPAAREAPADPATRPKPGSRVSAELVALYAEFEAHRRGGSTEPFAPRSTLVRVRNGAVLVDCFAAEDGAALRADLEALGLVGGATYKNAVSGWLPIAAIPELEGLVSLGRAAAAMAATGAATGAVAGAADPDPEPAG